ncbi:MAG: zinc metallopeptidase [Defluviitaleaceae bacterium]|nr:zinc metallopeptidase [Defluviitaleaceae bacterium]
MLPAFLLSMYAQHKVQSTFNKYTKVASKQGKTGAEVAAQLLAAAGIRDVKIEATPGQLTDHYDPRDKTVRLSEAVHNVRSLAALGVAAHEVGHAIQHNQSYGPLAFRSGLFPVVNIGSRLSMPLLLAGLVMGAGGFGDWLLYAGIIMFSVTVLFQVVTLPVEFNASSRAISMLQSERILSESEAAPAKRVLDAAALTYVAATITSLLTLIRYILIARRR